MATFAAVNVDAPGASAPLTSSSMERTASATTTMNGADGEGEQDASAEERSPETPTRHSFSGMLSQRPLPDELPSADVASRPSTTPDVTRPEDVHSSTARTPEDANDVEMGEADDDENADEYGSETESVTSDSQRPTKKKKGQRFFCTDYPPCQLSFTRSEHLARHIRKHTGERPFQCHCSRRFSRLDNLRQHAQTVHVNEDIPGDSLAATSTRFQRQIRTDRVRAPGSRSRTNTLGSQGGHSRGHSRNLSASSIASTASTMSTMSIPEEPRRRPQPLAMAGDGNARGQLNLDTHSYGASPHPAPQYAYYNQPSTGYTTPMSMSFNPNNGSPPYHTGGASPSSVVSPSTSHSTAHGHARRLSVPSSSNPYQPQPPPMTPYQAPYYSPAPSIAFSPSSSAYASPTSSVFTHRRHESESDMDYRRRTWHASSNNAQYTQRPATSGLTYHQTPDQPRPAFTQQPAASQLTRLPGIESFDHAPPVTARPQPSPRMSDDTPRPTSSGRALETAGLQHGLTRLDITAANGPGENHWQATPPRYGHSHSQSAHLPPPSFAQSHHASMPEPPVTPRRLKRNAWYGGPLTPTYANPAPSQSTYRPSPEDSGSSEGVQTPAIAHASEHHPVIYNPPPAVLSEAGYPAPAPAHAEEQQPYYAAKPEPSRADSGFQFPAPVDGRPTYALQAGHDPRFAQTNTANGSDSARLDALVSVALSTSEEHRTSQRT